MTIAALVAILAVVAAHLGISGGAVAAVTAAHLGISGGAATALLGGHLLTSHLAGHLVNHQVAEHIIHDLLKQGIPQCHQCRQTQCQSQPQPQWQWQFPRWSWTPPQQSSKGFETKRNPRYPGWSAAPSTGQLPT